MPDLEILERWANALGINTDMCRMLFARGFAYDTLRERGVRGTVGSGWDRKGAYVVVPRGYSREQFPDLPERAPNGVPVRYEFC